MVDVKICGISDAPGLNAAVKSGARYIGFVFYPRSPRNVTISQAGRLSAMLPDGIKSVALAVDPDDEMVAEIDAGMRVDVFQLHGSETVERVARIKKDTGKQVMKAFSLKTADDLEAVEPYLGTADWLLFDAKAPASMTGAMPGGNAVTFDWRFLSGRQWPLPWILSGGLDPHNVTRAIRVSGAPTVDVSSGVEHLPGKKDPDRIVSFMRAVRKAEALTP